MSRRGWLAKFRKARAAKPNEGRVDNNIRAIADKVELRRRVLAEVGGAVLDCFAGAGEMHRRIWHEAESYTGIDQRWFRDERRVYVADNRRVLRAIDLAPFRIFDLDSWGSPWEQAEIIAHRRSVKPGERIGFCLTEGAALRMRLGSAPTALARLAGIEAKAAGLMNGREEIIERAIDELCRRMDCVVRHAWGAQGRTAAKVSYMALVLEGTDVADSLGRERFSNTMGTLAPENP